ncbi:hypothetical protein JGU71_20930 [Antrihabitans sp. YC3-6]|uniref:Prenyltransferase n=1 Tax=Antrihabitans stalagmiti TaxID=2799499 RepID=A0A934U5A7_9NOCA|nr:hypothetical protein [Antrihabitans stalagmiti]MBJ8341354.1 hypothetical protein [Antrihabitans stalagmiti]
MTIDVVAAERFVHANARVLDRHRLAALRGRPADPVLTALRAYRNSDGGFGHALEPDVRTPDSETTCALHALEVLAEVGALGDDMVAPTVDWLAANDVDGGVPFVLPGAAAYPHGPWMVPTPGGSHLTFGIVGVLAAADLEHPWIARATEWCWDKLERPDELNAYWVKYALVFLDAVVDTARAAAVIDGFRPLLDEQGSVPVPGGTADERLTALTLSPHPGSRSRALFTDDQLEVDLDRMARGQHEDGGWTFDWLGWSPGQSAEWRGIVTLRALSALSLNGRISV